jgi:acyl carrier protein
MTHTDTSVAAEVERMIRENMTDLDDDEVITPDTTFDDLGMDSLTRIDVLADAEAFFGIQVPDDEVRKFVRVRDLTDFILSARA